MWLLQAVNEVLTNVEVEVGAHKGTCSLVPRPDPPEKEGPGIHCLQMRLKSWKNRGLLSYVCATMTSNFGLSLIGLYKFPGSNNGVQLRLHTVLLFPEAW